MQTVRERLIEEKNQLDEKIKKLSEFVSSSEFQKIDPIQMSLLNIQLPTMQSYSQILLERISLLK